ncbi:MAG: right-handed parallel beta-helix repeat-containing protein, partial [Thermoplasmata archaeon]
VLSNEFLNYNDWRGEATVIEVLQHSFPIIWNNSFESASRSIYISYSGGVIEGNSGYVRNYPWPGNDTGKRPCGGVGYYVDHSLEPLDIVGNWINYTGYSIYLVESSPRIERNHILHDFYPPGFVFNDYKDGPGVSWDEINRCAICVYHNSSPFIANNTLIGNSYGISIEGIQGKIARPIIFNNTIEKTGWMAISSSGWSPEYPANSEPNIIENTIRNSTGAGVFAADDGWANITGNIIEGTHGLTLKKPDTANETDEHYRSAISIGGWEPKFPGKDIGRGNKYVANNTISFGNHSSGIFIYWTPVTNLTVFNNTISEYPTGIYDDKRSDYHLIENNTISGIQEGIRIQSPASPVLLNNSISNTTRSESKGIVFFGKTARNSPYVLKENNSINNTRYGIFLNYTGEYITLIDIDWVHNTSYAIYTNRSIPTMKRVDIHGNPDGFGLFSIVSSPQIDEDSTFRENSNGSYFFGANGTLDPWIYDSHFDDNTRNGVILNTTSIYIEYLNASRNERGILAYGSTEGEPVYMNMKQGNLTYNTVGLYMLHGRSGQDIHGNNISGNQWGSFIKASSPDISYNDFMNNTYALVLYLDSASKVEWNTFSNSANHTEVRYGIYIEDCNYRSRQISLSNNTFSYVNQSIEIESSGKDYTGHDRNILVDYNRFRYSNYSITISSSGTSGKPIGIKNNNVTHNIEGKAIGIYSSIGEILVVSNYLWNVSVGVYIQSPSVTVERNTISVWGWGPTPIDSGPRGIYTNHGTTIIGNNTLDTTSRDVGWTEVNGIRGIWRFAFNNSVKSYEYGFRIEGGINSTIRGNHIEENGAGVRLWGAGVDPLIEENTFVDNVVGVLVQSNSSPTILNNTFESVGYLSAGIKVESGTPVIEGNTIYNIGQMGIWITGNGNPEIVQNTISYNDYGIKIQGGNATIHNNNSIHHNQWGIYMNTYNAPEVSENNTIYNNTQAGIWIGMNVGTFLKQIWWNDIVNNSVGIDVEDDPGQDNYFHCECNWWGDANGPNDPNPPPPDGDGPPDWNPNPNGQDVDDYFWYREKPPKPAPRLYWLVEPSLNSTTCYNEPS